MNDPVDIVDLTTLKVPIYECEPVPIYGRMGQDLFVIAMSAGKKNGTYLEIGCGYPVGGGNNTFALESYFNWSGISIDSGRDYISPTDPSATVFSLKDEWTNSRPTANFLQDNALGMDYSTFPKYFDYLQVDIDPPGQSFEVLKKITEHIKFSLITFEHDYVIPTYRSNNIRNLSRDYLKSLGYFLIIPDVGYSEDWWVDPSTVSQEVINAYTAKPNKNNWKESLLQNVRNT